MQGSLLDINQNTNSKVEKLSNSLIETENIPESNLFEKRKLTKEDEGLLVLGELLKYLRESKNFSSLMVCRKIKTITVENNLAEIDFETESDLKEFSLNERYVSTVKEFFDSKGLGIKLKEIIQVESDAEKLNKLLGGKLVIKHSKNV